MSFKVKDLMIDLTTQGQIHTGCQATYLCRLGCTAVTEVCHFHNSVIHLCRLYPTNPTPTDCGFAATQVCYGSWTPTDTTIYALTITPTPQFGAQQADSLKEQLQAALQAAEAQEKATEESLKPQSVADVDLPEKKLNEARDGLKVRKSELQKKPAK
jgi:hypothetical protein